MARAAKQTDEEKKETRKKKTPAKSKKSSSESGVWPCKMDGCNKQFAREADLKRHQRTTKNHSMPGFSGSACPQCDATFTRTDALRRHQKSRHNGVIIEPAEPPKNADGENEAGSSGSKAESRSASPTNKGKGKGKGKKNATTNDGAPASLANPGTAGPASGPTSYYRQHTMQNGVIMDPSQFPQNGLGIPTSATRLHQASWPPPPPWAAEGTQAQMGTISYHPSQPGFYQPSPYYRQNGAPMNGDPMNGAPVMQQPFVSQPQDMQNGMSPHQNASPAQQQQDNHAANNSAAMKNNPNPSSNQQGPGDVEMKDDVNTQGNVGNQVVPSAPVIDPSLDTSATTAGGSENTQEGNAGGHPQSQGSSSKPVSLEITQAAMEAVLQSAQRETGTPDGGRPSNGSPANGHLNVQASSHIGGSQQHLGSGLQGTGQAGASSSPQGGDTQMPVRTITTAKSPFAHQSPVSTPQPLPQIQTIPQPPAQQPPVPQHGARPEPMEPMLTEDGEPMLNPAELLTQVSATSDSNQIGAILDMLLSQESLASPPP